MTYYEKIEAYTTGKMNPVEQMVFEDELTENTVLQKEYEAYQTAQQLFNNGAKLLTTQDILSDSAHETAEKLIQYSANQLSEAEITEMPVSETSAKGRTISVRLSRSAWLAAASFLLLITVVGIRSNQNQTSWKGLGQDQPSVVAIPESQTIDPTSTIYELPETFQAEQVVAVSKKQLSPTPQKRVATKTIRPKKYEPAKVTIQPNPAITTAAIAAHNAAPATEAKPLAVNLYGETIRTRKTIGKGETVTYKAQQGITLRPGFHARAGANFVATTLPTNRQDELATESIYEGQQSVALEAGKTIIFRPGFHAKSGTDFTARTNPELSESEVAVNSIISQEEAVVTRAKKVITLKAGFHARAGADFTATVR